MIPKRNWHRYWGTHDQILIYTSTQAYNQFVNIVTRFNNRRKYGAQ